MAVYGFGAVVGLAYKPTLFEYIGSVLVRASARAICTHGYLVKKPWVEIRPAYQLVGSGYRETQAHLQLAIQRIQISRFPSPLS